MRAVAVDFATQTVETTVEVLVVDGQVIAADTYLAADDPTLDGTTVVVSGATLTVAGTHQFANLYVLDGVVEGVPEEPPDLRVSGTLGIYCDDEFQVGEAIFNL